jgi:acetyl esterase/lipase
MSSLAFDHEFFEGCKDLLPSMEPNKTSDPKNRNLGRLDWIKTQEKRYCHLLDDPSVTVTALKIPFSGHSEPISVYQLCPTRARQPSSSPFPAIIHTHSGGFIYGSVPYLLKRLKYQAAECGVQIFSIDYFLAPEYSYPHQLLECWTTLNWIHDNAKYLNIDPARIAVMGESAGGNLAAATALMARDRGLQPQLAKQILIYPMLDDRTIYQNPELERLAIWGHADNRDAWGAYLGDLAKVGGPGTSPYAAPARAESLASLPSTYIEVGGLDLFRDECIDYSSRIAKCNIDCEMHLYPGVTHSFEAINSQAAVSVRAWANLKAAMMSF